MSKRKRAKKAARDALGNMSEAAGSILACEDLFNDGKHPKYLQFLEAMLNQQGLLIEEMRAFIKHAWGS